MAFAALIKFSQGLSIGSPGVAFVGELTTTVTVANAVNDGSIILWIFRVLDAPPGSSVPIGTVQSGSTPTYTFSPDVRGSYHFELEVQIAGLVSKKHRLSFAVPEQSGRIIPPFDGEAPALNYAGGTRGRAVSVERYLRLIDGVSSQVVTTTGNIDDLGTQVSGEASQALRLTGAAPVLRGMANGYEGREIRVAVVNATTIANQASGSAAANRIDTGTGSDLSLTAGSIAAFRYESSRWRSLTGSSSGSAIVLDDIAKSSGLAIDRVRGLRAVPLAGSDGAVPPIGGAWAYNLQGGSSYKAGNPVPKGWLDVVHFGADPSGVADSTAAIQAAIDYLTTYANKAGVVYFPAGLYKISGRIFVHHRVVMLGAGMTEGSGGVNPVNGTELTLGPGSCVIFLAGGESGNPYGSGGTAVNSYIGHMGLTKYTRSTTTAWTNATHYTVGTKRIRVAPTGQIDNQRATFLRCIKEGDGHATTPPDVPQTPDVFTSQFLPATNYLVGQVVRGTTNQLAEAANGSNLITTRVFVVTQAGTSHATDRPVWDTDIGDFTTSGSCIFRAVDSNAIWVTDNTAVWAADFDGAVLGFTRLHAEFLHVHGMGGAGVYMRGVANDGFVSNCNSWSARNLRIVQCGVGFEVNGSDAQAGYAENLDIETAGFGMPGNGGVGIYDASGAGCTWVAPEVTNDPTLGGSHPYLVDGGGSSSAVLINPYSEGFGGSARNASHFPRSSTTVIGAGLLGGGVTDHLYPAADGSYTLAALIGPESRHEVFRTTISNASDSTAGGSTGNITAFNPVSHVQTIQGLSGLDASYVGRTITISGCATAGNNGAFRISSVVGATEASYTNENAGAASSDANDGSIVWFTGGGDVRAFHGAHDFNGAVIGFSGPGYTGSNKNVFGYAPVLTGGFPSDWWAYSYNGAANAASFAIPGPNAKWPSGSAIGEYGAWVLGRLWMGTSTTDRPSIEMSANVPSSGRHMRGSIAYNTDSDNATIIGWICTVTGTPGTWVEITNGAVGVTGPTIVNATSGTQNNVASDESGTPAGAIEFSAATTITGIAGGTEGRSIEIHANGATTILKNNDSGSTAANRFTLPHGEDFIIEEDSVQEIWWDVTTSRWFVEDVAGHLFPKIVLAEGFSPSGENDGEAEHRGSPRHYSDSGDNSHEDYLTNGPPDGAGTDAWGASRTRYQSAQTINATPVAAGFVIVPPAWGDGIITIVARACVCYSTGDPTGGIIVQEGVFKREGSTITQIAEAETGAPALRPPDGGVVMTLDPDGDDQQINLLITGRSDRDTQWKFAFLVQFATDTGDNPT